MKTQRPIMMTGEEHVVLQFRPRELPEQRIAANAVNTRSLHEPNDLSRYERPREQPDDFRHRMLANAAAFAFTIALTAVGLWLAVSIADLRSTQDCALMGLQNCARIPAPHE